MKKLQLMVVSMITVFMLSACSTSGSGSPEFLKGNDTHVFTLGSLVSTGDTYNITESNGASVGYKSAYTQGGL